jgi:hypothetical protein
MLKGAVMRSKSILGTLLVTSALGLSVAACREDSRPLAVADTAWPATLPAAYPGPVEDRYGPPPQRVPVGRLASYDDSWAWADRAYALDRAFYETPPDYGFAYDEYEPWVWQTSDRWAMYGDPYADDDWRYYYYQPGAVRPYFIRDDHYGYGYDDAGRLIAVFDLLGRLLGQQDLYRYDDAASRYYQRAYLIRQASLRAQPIVITREVWLEQAPIIQRTTSVWINSAQQQPDWVRYRERDGGKFVRAFDDERRRRETILTTAQASPDRDQRRGVFGRPAAETRQQVASLQTDRRGVFDRRDRADDQVRERGAGKSDRRGPDSRGFVATPQSDARDLSKSKGRKDERRAAQQDRQARAPVEQRQAEDRGRKQREAQQQQERQQKDQAQARQHEHERQQQAEAQARKQQQDQQRQAEAQGRKQQQDQQRQAEAQGRKQQQDQQRQAEAQGRKQQQDQQRQAEAQGRKQQQDQQRQAEAQARGQQQAKEQAQKQQAQKQQAQKQQAQKQQADKQQAEKQHGQKQEAQAADQASQGQGKGGGKGHKG